MIVYVLTLPQWLAWHAHHR